MQEKIDTGKEFKKGPGSSGRTFIISPLKLEGQWKIILPPNSNWK